MLSEASESPLPCVERTSPAWPGTPAHPRDGACPERGSPGRRAPWTSRSRCPTRGARQGCRLRCEPGRQGHVRRPLPDPVPLLRGAARPRAALRRGRADHAAAGPGRRLVGRREGGRAPRLVPSELCAVVGGKGRGPGAGRPEAPVLGALADLLPAPGMPEPPLPEWRPGGSRCASNP